jgi:hypothetical protein
MDARRTERLVGRARALPGRAEDDDLTGVDLLDRAEEAVGDARRLRDSSAWVRAEFERLQRRIRIGWRPVP